MVNFTPIGAAAADSTASAAATTKKSDLGQDAFLQLLVAQIRNQNPLNPADGVQFLSQLAQFSQLEQSVGIRDEMKGLRTQVDSIISAMPEKTDKTESTTTGDKNV